MTDQWTGSDDKHTDSQLTLWLQYQQDQRIEADNDETVVYLSYPDLITETAVDEMNAADDHHHSCEDDDELAGYGYCFEVEGEL